MTHSHSIKHVKVIPWPIKKSLGLTSARMSYKFPPIILKTSSLKSPEINVIGVFCLYVQCVSTPCLDFLEYISLRSSSDIFWKLWDCWNKTVMNPMVYHTIMYLEPPLCTSFSNQTDCMQLIVITFSVTFQNKRFGKLLPQPNHWQRHHNKCVLNLNDTKHFPFLPTYSLSPRLFYLGKKTHDRWHLTYLLIT